MASERFPRPSLGYETRRRYSPTPSGVTRRPPERLRGYSAYFSRIIVSARSFTPAEYLLVLS